MYWIMCFWGVGGGCGLRILIALFFSTSLHFIVVCQNGWADARNLLREPLENLSEIFPRSKSSQKSVSNTIQLILLRLVTGFLCHESFNMLYIASYI